MTTIVRAPRPKGVFYLGEGNANKQNQIKRRKIKNSASFKINVLTVLEGVGEVEKNIRTSAMDSRRVRVSVLEMRARWYVSGKPVSRNRGAKMSANIHFEGSHSIIITKSSISARGSHF